MAKIYDGKRPFIFVSYAHADSEFVLRIIDALDSAGYRVWYDQGIPWSDDWANTIAAHVRDCSHFLAFVSKEFAQSDYCNKEVGLATDSKKKMMVVYMKDMDLRQLSQLNPGMHLNIFQRQAMFLNDFESDQAFVASVVSQSVLEPCLREDAGGLKRGLGGGSTKSSANVIAIVTSVLAAIIAIVLIVNGMTDTSSVESDTTSRTTSTSSQSLSGYSWTDLKDIADEIAAASDDEWMKIARSYGLVDSEYELQGDTKTITLNDEAGTEAEVRIAGFRHDDRADGKGKAGITFEFADVPMTHAMNSENENKGGWADSEMREYLNGDFLKLLPNDLSTNMVTVKKYTNNTGYVEAEGNTSVVTSTEDKLWLLSMSEVYGKLPDWLRNDEERSEVYDVEGIQYKVYVEHSDSGSNWDFCGKLTNTGVALDWWLRSPDIRGTSDFRFAAIGGNMANGNAFGVKGVSPGFCF